MLSADPNPYPVTVKEIVDETVHDNFTDLFNKVCSLRAFVEDIMHPFDFESLKYKFAKKITRSDGSPVIDSLGNQVRDMNAVDHHRMWVSLENTLKSEDYCTFSGAGREDFRFVIKKSPYPTPTTLTQAIEIIDSQRVTAKAWKDLAYKLRLFAGGMDAMKRSTDEAMRQNFQMATLIAYLFEVAKDYEVHVPQKDRQILAPSKELLEEMLASPKKHFHLSRLQELFKVYSWRETNDADSEVS